MTRTNTLRSRIQGIELGGEVHPSSTWFIVALRLLMGGMMLFAGLSKLLGESFNASGYLANVDPASPVSGLYAAMAANPALIDAINVIVPLTQVLIGLALVAGLAVRLAAFGGAIQMMMFYLGGWEGELLALFDSTLIYAFLFLALGAFAAGRLLGVDEYVEEFSVVQKYPRLKYLLG